MTSYSTFFHIDQATLYMWLYYNYYHVNRTTWNLTWALESNRTTPPCCQESPARWEDSIPSRKPSITPWSPYFLIPDHSGLTRDLHMPLLSWNSLWIEVEGSKMKIYTYWCLETTWRIKISSNLMSLQKKMLIISSENNKLLIDHIVKSYNLQTSYVTIVGRFIYFEEIVQNGCHGNNFH